jgi:DNA-binding NtrC family response regulator
MVHLDHFDWRLQKRWTVQSWKCVATMTSSEVLLVDDNPMQLSVREAVLRNAGFQVSVATTADGALAVLRGSRERVGVVVTDHLMPHCNGAELVRQIRADGNWLPIIVLSGLADAESEYHGQEVIFRPKPLPPPELIDLVRSSLERSGHQRGAA